VEFGEGEDMFIEDHISGNIDTPFIDIQTLEPLVYVTES